MITRIQILTQEHGGSSRIVHYPHNATIFTLVKDDILHLAMELFTIKDLSGDNRFLLDEALIQIDTKVPNINKSIFDMHLYELSDTLLEFYTPHTDSTLLLTIERPVSLEDIESVKKKRLVT